MNVAFLLKADHPPLGSFCGYQQPPRNEPSSWLNVR
jgi:hypothetical protein